jgi:hypothetical protein
MGGVKRNPSFTLNLPGGHSKNSSVTAKTALLSVHILYCIAFGF